MSLERLPLPFLGSRVREPLEPLQHVPVITEHVHPFVISEQHVDPPARAPGLALQADQQINRLTNLVAAIQDVAGLDQAGRPAAPFPLGVDQARGLEDLGQPRPRAVDVADGDDPWPGRTLRRHARRVQGDECQDAGREEKRESAAQWSAVERRSRLVA